MAVVSTESFSEAVEDVSSIADEAGWELLSDKNKAKEAQESLKNSVILTDGSYTNTH